MPAKSKPPLHGRSRDHAKPKAGQIHEKRGDTLVRTLREEYGHDFLRGYKPEDTLGYVRERTGKSLHQLVQEYRNR